MDSGIFILAPYQTGGPSPRLTRRSKVQPATLFTPQDRNLSPEAHFPLQTVSGPDRTPFPRFINRFNSREILLVVDGSCINNGRHANKLQDPVGGCSFIFKGGSITPSLSLRDTTNPPIPATLPFFGSGTTTTTTTTNNNGSHKKEPRPPGAIAFRLENHGPSGIPTEPTSNRAKLRAVIAALQFRAWGSEGWRRVVVLTDLEYIIWGATQWYV
jgi:ribonuclease HI